VAVAVKLIIDAAAVRERYVLQDLPDINAAIDSALPSAHIFFQEILGTEFTEQVHRDVFYLDDDLFPALLNDQFRLRLKQAFLKPGTLAINYAETRRLALSGDILLLDETDFFVDMDKGLVFVDAVGTERALHKTYVVVEYTAGFGTGAGAVKPPDWLKEAVMAYMASAWLYSSHGEEPEKTAKQALEIQQAAANMVNSHKRETALQLLPLY
jgi:hypothetical protein